eukprot:3745594-Pyramimonas_sp.AAC.1
MPAPSDLKPGQGESAPCRRPRGRGRGRLLLQGLVEYAIGAGVISYPLLRIAHGFAHSRYLRPRLQLLRTANKGFQNRGCRRQGTLEKADPLVDRPHGRWAASSYHTTGHKS